MTQVTSEPIVKLVDVTDSHDHNVNALSSAGAEFLFVLLPFIVFAIVFGHLDRLRTFAQIPEWSFAAVVMFGQSLVRLTTAVIGATAVLKERFALLFSGILVLGLVPSLVVLGLVFGAQQVSTGLAVAQILLFLAATVVFAFANWVHYMETHK